MIDDTLYCHGGVACADYRDGAVDCVGYVPGRSERVEDVREWVAALNAWKDEKIAEWTAQPQWDAPKKNNCRAGHRRGGWQLLDGEYIGPNCVPSVVMGRYGVCGIRPAGGIQPAGGIRPSSRV